MNILRRTVMALGSMTVVALVIALAAPKTAHGFVATLVQVMNTPTTAIPVVQAPAASELYVNTCQSDYSGHVIAFCTFPAVPAGKTLIAEAVSIASSSSSGIDPTEADLTNSAGVYYFIPMIRQAPTATLDVYTGAIGARFYTTTTPTCQVLLSDVSFGGAIACTISGYLVPAS